MSAVKSVIDFPKLGLVVPSLSPDGRYVSMFASSGDQEGRTLVVRRLDDGAVTWLAGTERAQPATWSPDSRSVAFLRDGELKVADVATGGARTIGRVPADVRDSAWNHEGIILLGGSRLRRLSVSDGHLTDVYRPGAGIIRQFAPRSSPTDERSSTPRTAATPSNGACSSGHWTLRRSPGCCPNRRTLRSRRAATFCMAIKGPCSPSVSISTTSASWETRSTSVRAPGTSDRTPALRSRVTCSSGPTFRRPRPT